MSKTDKQKTIHELSELSHLLRAEGKRMVYCRGIFELLHIGQIRFFEQAKRLGDVLVVAVTADRYIDGDLENPSFNESQRVEALAALSCVDYASVSDLPSAVDAIRLLKPSVYVTSTKLDNHSITELHHEIEAAHEVGATCEYIEDIALSSGRTANGNRSPFSMEEEHYIAQLREKYSADDIFRCLKRARSLKVLVVGEAIIDEYYRCSAMEKSSKAPILAARYHSHERFAGGAVAVANHVASFCDEVHLLSMLGSENTEEDWIRERLRSNVSAEIVYKQNSPTIVKRRYQESYFDNMLFAINFLDDAPMADDEDASVCKLLGNIVENFDIVIVADYGHSFLSDEATRIICDRALASCRLSTSQLGKLWISYYYEIPSGGLRLFVASGTRTCLSPPK